MIEMATFNSTEALAVRGSAAFPASLLCMPELEKISCSVKGVSRLHPLVLIGKRIRKAQLSHSCTVADYPFPPESSISVAIVLAVSLGSIHHSIETSLLLQDEESGDQYFADISTLTVLEVLQ